MKLSELRSAIRKMKGNPSVVVELTPGIPMALVLQKTPTLETLGLAYGDTKDDIGLTITDDGLITSVNRQAAFYADPVANVEPVGDCPDLDDEEDML